MLTPRVCIGRSLSDIGLALANRGLVHLQHSALVPRGPHFGIKSEHI